MLYLVLILFVSFAPDILLSIQCYSCDSFEGYCDFDGQSCVGPKCSRRTAPMPNGLIREQRLCVPSDSPLGCRKAFLWDEMEGVECVCEENKCNLAEKSFVYSAIFLVFIILF